MPKAKPATTTKATAKPTKRRVLPQRAPGPGRNTLLSRFLRSQPHPDPAPVSSVLGCWLSLLRPPSIG